MVSYGYSPAYLREIDCEEAGLLLEACRDRELREMRRTAWIVATMLNVANAGAKSRKTVTIEELLGIKQKPKKDEETVKMLNQMTRKK